MSLPNGGLFKTLSELKALTRLAVPILIGQVAIAGLGVVDTMMSAQVGTADLAAIGLGSSVLLPVMMLAIGLMMTLTPLVAKSSGKREHANVALTFQQGLWLTLPVGAVIAAILMNAELLLSYLPLEPKVYSLTNDYLFYIAFGMPFLTGYFAVRFFWEGLGYTRPTMVISLLALALNVPLNALFIYGWGPVPAFGAAGCGIASAIVMLLMFLVSVKVVTQNIRLRKIAFFTLTGWSRPKWSNGIGPILSLGVPNTLALLFETGLFSFMSIFIASLGTQAIAANQVALSYTSLVFMLPLSIGLAMSVRVGRAYGRGKANDVRAAIYTGVMMGIAVSLVVAFITYGFRFSISEAYSDQPQVIVIAAGLLAIAALYQLFDAIQVTTAGALRGLHRTRETMWVTLLSYWGIGLGIGSVFTFTDWLTPEPLGVSGYWWAIVLGFVLAAISLQYFLKRRLTQLETSREIQ